MYLSRLILNPRSRQVRRDVADPYQMHRTIMRAFPAELPPDERVLFRLDTDRRSGLLTLLVQSQHEPDWGWLRAPDNFYLLLTTQLPPPLERNPDTKQVDLRDRLHDGQRLAFRLRANPTVKRTIEKNGEKAKKRVGLYKEDDQIQWLQRKAEQGGFHLLSVRTRKDDRLNQGHLTREGKQHDLKMLSVQFDGMLQVTDSKQLLRTIAQGIGSGKGLGFGLLSLAPAQT